MANFGGVPSKSMLDHNNSYKILVFTSLVSGLMIWIFYQGAFTSELANKLVKYPFDDLESFSQSKYK